MKLEDVLEVIERLMDQHQHHMEQAVRRRDVDRAMLELGAKDGCDQVRRELEYEEARLRRVQQASSPNS